METVGLRLLKEHLGEYVARASAGDRIVVTDRGTEVAELGPVPAARRVALELARQGAVRWDGGKPKGLRGIHVSGQPISETVVDDRR